MSRAPRVAALAVALAALAAGCGSANHHSAAPPPPTTRPAAPSTSTAVAGGGAVAPVTTTTVPPAAASPSLPPGSPELGSLGADNSKDDEGTTPVTTVVNPCSLVSGAEAAAILSAPVARPVEEPMGPTCVYRTTSGTATVTVSIQTLDVNQVRPLMQNVVVAAEAGHTTYCGNYGQPTLLAPLTRPSALEIVAPCPVAQQFAARALPRI